MDEAGPGRQGRGAARSSARDSAAGSAVTGGACGVAGRLEPPAAAAGAEAVGRLRSSGAAAGADVAAARIGDRAAGAGLPSGASDAGRSTVARPAASASSIESRASVIFAPRSNSLSRCWSSLVLDHRMSTAATRTTSRMNSIAVPPGPSGPRPDPRLQSVDAPTADVLQA